MAIFLTTDYATAHKLTMNKNERIMCGGTELLVSTKKQGKDTVIYLDLLNYAKEKSKTQKD